MSARLLMMFRPKAGILHRINSGTSNNGTLNQLAITPLGVMLVSGRNLTKYYRSPSRGDFGTWTEYNTLPYGLQLLRYLNGLFIAICSDNGSNHRVLTSPDGITWTTYTPNSGLVGLTCTDMIWNGTNYIVYATSNDANLQRCFLTSGGGNLASWSVSSFGANNTGLYEVVKLGNVFIGRRPTSFIALGTDGVTEGTVYSPGVDLPSALRSIPQASMFVRGDTLYCISRTRVLTTQDGDTWSYYAHDIASNPVAVSVVFLPADILDMVQAGGSDSGTVQPLSARAASGSYVANPYFISGIAQYGVHSNGVAYLLSKAFSSTALYSFAAR